MIPRRKAMHLMVGSLLLSVAGCGNPNATPVRILSIVNVEIDERDDYWQVSLDVGNTYQARDELAEFTDVTVLAYDRESHRVGSKHIGNVTAEDKTNMPITVKMRCSTFPKMITFDAAESPCDDDIRTEIDMWVYLEDGGYWSSACSRRCGEGLPPDPREECLQSDDDQA